MTGTKPLVQARESAFSERIAKCNKDAKSLWSNIWPPVSPFHFPHKPEVLSLTIIIHQPGLFRGINSPSLFWNRLCSLSFFFFLATNSTRPAATARRPLRMPRLLATDRRHIPGSLAGKCQ